MHDSHFDTIRDFPNDPKVLLVDRSTDEFNFIPDEKKKAHTHGQWADQTKTKEAQVRLMGQLTDSKLGPYGTLQGSKDKDISYLHT
jgi:hypothetical protein